MPIDGLTLRAGIFNILDKKYAWWSDVRGLASTSTVTDAYTHQAATHGAAGACFSPPRTAKMTNYRKIVATLLLCAAALPAAPAHPPIAADAAAATFEQDRADILAMAGNWQGAADMRNRRVGILTTSRSSPSRRQRSGARDQDTGRKIVQHLLVIEHEGKSHIIKHWRQIGNMNRQDPRLFDRNAWAWEDVLSGCAPAAGRTVIRSTTARATCGQPASKRRAASVAGGRVDVAAARAAMRRNPVYDRYLSINRHQLARRLDPLAGQ